MSESGLRIAITGAVGYVGTTLIRRLEREPAVERVLAIDVRPPTRPSSPRVVFLQQDILTPLAAPLKQHGTDAMAHLAYVVRPGHRGSEARRTNVDGTASVLDACAEAGVRRIAYLSSTSVYGAHPDNPLLLTEDSPLRPIQGFQYSENKLEAEALVQRFAKERRDVVTTVLRGAPVLGRDADNPIARAFLKPFLVAFWGHDPLMQFVHQDDMAEVLCQCLLKPRPEVFNVAGSGDVSWSEVAGILGRRLVRLPAPLLQAGTAAAWAMHLQSDSPPAGLDLIRYPWTVSTERAERELGVRFRHSREAVEAFAGRRQGSPP